MSRTKWVVKVVPTELVFIRSWKLAIFNHILKGASLLTPTYKVVSHHADKRKPFIRIREGSSKYLMLKSIYDYYEMADLDRDELPHTLFDPKGQMLWELSQIESDSGLVDDLIFIYLKSKGELMIETDYYPESEDEENDYHQ